MDLKPLLLSLALAVNALGSDERPRVILDAVAVQNLQLATVEAEETAFEETLLVLGRIRVAPGHRAVVSSRVPGRALEVSAHIDTKIQKGARVVLLESRQPGDPPPAIGLVAPITGHVASLKVAPGQPVNVEDSLIELVDLSAVHAVAELPEHWAHRVRIGQKARIRVTGYPETEYESEVEHLGAEADAATGTVEVAFHVANPKELLRPGMRAEFSIVTARREAVMSVPAEAVQSDGAGRFVFVADPELKHAYEKVPVVLGARNGASVEVKSGLLPGDPVVTRGAYALAFAGKGNTSLKEAMDAAHGHAHAEDGSELGGGGHDGHEGHDHHDGHAGGWAPVTWFFAGTSGVFFVLLLLLGAKLSKRSALPPGHAQ
jgi:multidrug efflux pump subunit AcrA (membrane-fusion protein)